MDVRCLAAVLAVLIIPAVAVNAVAERPPARCNYPRTYRIVRVDDGFPVSKEEFRTAVRGAARMWRAETGVEWFREASDGVISVSLEYGPVQETYTAMLALQEEGKLVEADIVRFNEHMQGLNSEVEKLNGKLREYEQAVEGFNGRAAEWNENPGTPEEMQELRDNQIALEQWRRQLDEEKRVLELQSSEMNKDRRQIKQGRQVLQNDQELLSFVTGGKLDFDRAGVYLHGGRGEQIKVFMMADQNELRNVLAHEFGHALGLGHVIDARAIMSAELSDKNRRNSRVSASDVHELRQVCGQSMR